VGLLEGLLWRTTSPSESCSDRTALLSWPAPASPSAKYPSLLIDTSIRPDSSSLPGPVIKFDTALLGHPSTCQVVYPAACARLPILSPAHWHIPPYHLQFNNYIHLSFQSVVVQENGFATLFCSLFESKAGRSSGHSLRSVPGSQRCPGIGIDQGRALKSVLRSL
jgi:hypothetical protein